MGKIAKTGNEVVDRIKMVSYAKGVSLKFLCEKIGRGKSYFSDVVNGSGVIPDDRLEIISNILQEPKVYLLTGKYGPSWIVSQKENFPDTVSDTEGLTDEEKRFLEKFRAASEDKRQAAEYVLGLK